MNKNVVVKQIEGAEVPVEVLAASIKTIAEGVRKLRAGPLNDHALRLLIQHAAPSYRGTPISMRDIKGVLEGLESLEATYLKKKAAPRG